MWAEYGSFGVCKLTSYQLFKVEKVAQIEVHILNQNIPSIANVDPNKQLHAATSAQYSTSQSANVSKPKHV